MRKINLLLIIVSLVLIFSGCEENDSPVVFDHNASMEGDVTFLDGTADTLSAEVTASRNNILLAETFTDEMGHYMFTGLSAGEYYISIKSSGYSSQSFTIELFNNETITAEAVIMEPMANMQFSSKVIDGAIDGGWMPVYTNTHDSNWGPNDFDELYLAYDDEYLYVALTGEFEENDQNSMTMLFDTDLNGDTGVNDLTEINGGNPGNRMKKNIYMPDSFGADFAFNSGFRLSEEGGVFSLVNPSQVDEGLLEGVITEMSTSVIEFAVPMNGLYENQLHPDAISLVAFIGGGDMVNFANDTIPQGSGDFEGTFQEVFTIGY